MDRTSATWGPRGVPRAGGPAPRPRLWTRAPHRARSGRRGRGGAGRVREGVEGAAEISRGGRVLDLALPHRGAPRDRPGLATPRAAHASREARSERDRAGSGRGSGRCGRSRRAARGDDVETDGGAARGGDALLLSGPFGRRGGEAARHSGEHREDSPESRARHAALGLARGRGMMNCAAFERWLDEGAPQDLAAAAQAHASQCARCAAAERAARSLELALSATATPAPAGFTERVMARVGGRAQAPALLPALPWWIRAAMEPATVLAMLAAGAVVW